jgi:DNA-binding CsgD family transcriptional regulator
LREFAPVAAQGSTGGPSAGADVAPHRREDRLSLLLEREPETALLNRVLDRACAGEGRRLLVQGPAGIGKSSLVEVAADLSIGRGMRVLRAEALEEASGLAFAVTEQLLGDEVASGAADRTPESDPQAITARLAQLMLELASAQPLLVAVDDAQWADGATLRWLAVLSARLQSAPIVVLLAIRSGAPAPQTSVWRRLVDPRRAAVLRPAPLSDGAAKTLLSARLGREPGTELLAACQRQAQGNPFLLGVLGDAIHQAGAMDRSDPATWVAELGSRALVDTIALRLGSLSHDARLLAEAAAVTGDVGGPARVAALAGLDSSRAADAAAELSVSDLVRGGPSLEFTHPLVRGAIRAGVPAARREQLQRSAVRLLADEDRLEAAAARLVELPPAGDTAAAELLHRAAIQAGARGAPEVAVELLRRALTEPPSHDRLAEIQGALAQGLLALGDPQAVAAFERWFALARSPAERAAAARGLALALAYALRIVEACKLLERAAAEVRDTEPGLSEELEAEMIRNMLFDPSLQERRVALLKTRTRARGASELAHRMRLVELAIEHNGACAPAGETAALAERALAGGLLLSRAPATHASALTVLIHTGRTGVARTHLQDAIGLARSRGEIVTLATRLALLAEAQRRAGDLAGAEADVRTALELTLDVPVGPPWMAATLLETLVERGEVAEAELELRRLGLTGELPNFLTRGLMLCARAQVRIAGGGTRLGLEDLLLAGEDLERFRCDTPAAVPWRAVAAEALLELGEPAEAAALSARELELAQRIGAPEVLGPALRVRGRVLGGEDGRAMLERAVAVLAPSTARLEHAKALCDLAANLRAEAPERARRLLGTALGHAEQLGANRLAARARDELVSAGARPRRRATGAAALTPSERRIADLAAQGLSNREIAETLVVATKTVETHLGGAYRKLRIRARAELAPALGRLVQSEEVRGKHQGCWG